MFTYNFVNRRGGKRTWYAYKEDDGIAPSWGKDGHHSPPWSWTARYYDSKDIAANQVQRPSLPQKKMKIYVQGQDTVGPYVIQNGHHAVITPNEGRRVVVSVEDAETAVDAALRGTTPLANEARDDETLRKVTEVASIVLGGVATALSAMGPPFAVGAGLAAVLGPLVASGFPEEGGAPAPPDLGQIKAAFKDVLAEHHADELATFFASTYDWLSQTEQEIAAAGSSVPQLLAERFKNHVEGAFDPFDKDSFGNQLKYVSDRPHIGKYLIPEFILAIGLFLELRRIQIGETYLVTDSGRSERTSPSIPASLVTGLLNDARRFRQGLDAAKDAFVELRNQHVEATGLNKTPEAIVVIKLVSRHYLGVAYGARDESYEKAFPGGTTFVSDGDGYAGTEDPVDKALDQLDDVIGYLEQDEKLVAAGKWPIHLLHVATPPADPVTQ